MATKPFVEVALMLHGVNGSFSFADYLNDNGEFINIGTQAAAAIARREAIHLYDENQGDNGAEVVIPFHAISIALTSKESGEYTKPEDDFCQPQESHTCDTEYTVTWKQIVDVDDESTDILLGTETYCEGSIPSYKGATPTAVDLEFVGWNSSRAIPGEGTALAELPAVTEAVTYYTIFTTGEQGNE